ncbi:MAG: hypothetical protein M3R24_32030 [Chloroflexota bacterium]|nr:hypothetical protein [Chloroflexota bacterium]
MPVVHFLNVKNGDCSVIQHGSGHVSVIDVCNARFPEGREAALTKSFQPLPQTPRTAPINFNQKAYPVNPIEYLEDRGITSVFRFILTHPDMDHMDGIKDFFEAFNPTNFYDTNNWKEMSSKEFFAYRLEDWAFYKSLRDNRPTTKPKRLTLYSGHVGSYMTRDWNGKPPGDAINVLAPTPELVATANQNQDYNDCSYVILYRGSAGTVLFAGDSHDATWEHILDQHGPKIYNIDLLIAPHHGRKSGRDYSFLDVLNPKMTFFGNAKAEHLAYSAWHSRGLPYVTNNQANCMIVDAAVPGMPLFVTNQAFARYRNVNTFYDPEYDAWFLQNINEY